MDREHLCDSLLIWLQTFNVDGPNKTVEELTDGIAMAQVLHQIAPAFFTDIWMTKLKTDISNNWRLKVSNLKKILKGILDYYAEVLGQQIQDFHMPDVNAIGESSDTGDLGRLLQLILGCAVNCEDKHEYIQRIMSMEEAVQHVVMNAIQELMMKEMPSGAEGGGNEVKRMMDELNNVTEAKEEIAQRCHELDLQVASLQEEKASLIAENDRLNERVNQADSLEDPRIEFLNWNDWPEEWKSTPAGRRYHQLQSQVEQLQDELYRLETARDDYRIKVELQEKEMLELHGKNEELTSLAEEARILKDEMDIMKHTTDKVAKYEAQIETYKKKLEELSDLRGQVKLLEDKNTSYMQKNLELEEDLRKGQAVKSQLELYKRQVQELQIKASEETKRGDKAEFESKRIIEKMSSLQREKERLMEERDALKATNEELTCTQLQKESLVGDSDSAMSLEGGLIDMMAVPPEIKERIIRLQHENKMLKLQRETNDDEKVQLMQTMLDDANARKNELESEVRISNQRILELEAQLEDFAETQRQSEKSSDSEAAGLRRRYAEVTQRVSSLETELHKRNSQVEDLEPKLTGAMEKVSTVQEQLAKKDDDMRAMEERYKRYLEKAKSVIRTLDPKLNPAPGNEMQALRNQLQEKDRLIEHLEKDHDKTKHLREQEEKLITTAWYNMGMQLHRKAAEERLANSGAGQSFLARQRQAHTRRGPPIAQQHITASR